MICLFIALSVVSGSVQLERRYLNTCVSGTKSI